MIRIILGDCLEEMRRLPTGSVDAVFTSPPYNLRNSTSGTYRYPESAPSTPLADGYDGHDDDLSHAEYVSWQRECLSEMMRITAPAGVIFYQHKWRCQDGLLQDRADIVQGFPVRQILIWDRGSSQNQNRSYFFPVYEVIYMIAKPGFMLRRGSTGVPAVLRIDRAPASDHPAPFPVALPRTVLGATEAKSVLDPFIGSGSTALAAMDLDIDCIGIEKSERYHRMAMERVQSYGPQRAMI